MATKKRSSRSQLTVLAQGFGLLSDPTRLGILTLLVKGPKNVTALCKALRLKQPAVSHHLGLLRMGRLINGVRQGKSMVYTADKQALKALAMALGTLTPKRGGLSAHRRDPQISLTLK